jgi:hypothetical protein
MSIRVFTAKEASSSVGPDVLEISAKKESKTFQGTTFFNIRFNIAGVKGGSGYFNNQIDTAPSGEPVFEDIALVRGIADPSDQNDKRNQFEGTRMQVETTVKRAGLTGQFLLGIAPVYVAKVQALQASGTMIAKKPINDLIGLKFSEEHKDAEKRGKPLDDPSIRFKIEPWENFPDGFPVKALVGKPRTEIYDWDTRKVDAEGRETFEIATVEDDAGNKVPLTKDNIHKFINRGAVIKRIRYFITSVPQAKGQVSCPIVANKLVIKTGGAAGFSDDFVSYKPAAPVAQPAAPAETIAPASDEAVAAAILAASSLGSL